jgi:hypothetical protein
MIKKQHPSLLGFCCYSEHLSPDLHHINVDIIALHKGLPPQAKNECFNLVLSPVLQQLLKPIDLEPGVCGAFILNHCSL